MSLRFDSKKGLNVFQKNFNKYDYEQAGSTNGHNRVHLTRKQKRRKRYTDNFNKIFWFFLRSYRCGILSFCGSEVNVSFDINSEEGKFCFRSYDNGEYKLTIPITRHPNILKGVIIGKKGWGLFVKETTEGITEFLFTKNEILDQFKENNIKIPDCLLLDFEKTLRKKWLLKHEKGLIFY